MDNSHEIPLQLVPSHFLTLGHISLACQPGFDYCLPAPRCELLVYYSPLFYETRNHLDPLCMEKGADDSFPPFWIQICFSFPTIRIECNDYECAEGNIVPSYEPEREEHFLF